MTLSPDPDTLYSLRANHLTINPPTIPTNASSLHSLPSLRLKVTAQLLIPSAWVPDKGRRPNGIEENLEVIVPIGGRVGFGLKVVATGLGLGPETRDPAGRQGDLRPGSSNCEAGEGDPQAITKAALGLLDNLFRSNKQTLGIKAVETTRQGTPPGVSQELDPPHCSLALVPVIADPVYSPLSNHLILPGSPVAHLQRLNISIEWVRRKRHLKTKRPDGEEGETHELDQVSSRCNHHGQISGNNGCDEALGVDQDSRSVADDHHELIEDESVLGESDDDDLLVDEIREGSVVARSEDNSHPQASVAEEVTQTYDNAFGLPAWASQQIEHGLKRMIRVHLIKRFPLIFDGSMISYTSMCSVPASLFQAASNMISLSRVHKTGLCLKAISRLSSINKLEEQDVTIRVRNLVGTVRRRKASLDNSYDEGPPAKRRRRSGRIQDDDVDDFVNDYLSTLRGAIWDQTHGAKRSQEARLQSVVDSAMKRIRRGEWDSRRGGSGRMAIARIPLHTQTIEMDAPDQLPALGTESESQWDRAESEANDNEDLLLEDDQDESLIDEEESGGMARQRSYLDSLYDGREACYRSDGRTDGWGIDESNADRDDDVDKQDDTVVAQSQPSTARLPEVDFQSGVGQYGAEAYVDDPEARVSLLDEDEMLDIHVIVSTDNVSDDGLIEDGIESSWPSTASLDSSVDTTTEKESVSTCLSFKNDEADFRTAKPDPCHVHQTLLLTGDEETRFAGLFCQGFRF